MSKTRNTHPNGAWLRTVVATLVGVITVAGVTIAEAPAAGAAAGCTTSTPALSVLDTCTSAGTQTITVPNGAATVNLSVIGAGGGGSDFNVFPAGGGSGADLSGLAALPTGTTAIQVVVGAGGSPGTGTSGDGGTGGHGGGGSAIFAYDGGTLLGAIAIAGAGGGSGGMDLGDPGFNLYGPGGNAGAAGGIGGISGSFMANGGGAATAATGGTGGNAGGTAGGDASAGTVATGGAGAVLSSHQRGGGGGGGYAGGGGGGALAEGSDDQFAGGGGGGGSSYNDPTNFPSPSSSIASNGGSSCASYIPIQFCAPTAGGTGSVSVTFGGAVPVVGPISPTSGPTGGGGTLTLHGVDLTGTTGVTVGGNACTSVSVVSDTEVTCTLPAGTAGSADVVVTNGNGSTTLTGGYDYLAPPTVTSVSPTEGPTAGGGTLTITGTSLTGTTVVTVGGNPCTSVSVVSATEVTCTLPEGTAGSADVVVTTPGGSVTDSGAYTYVAAPTITSVSPTEGPTGGGGTLTIDGTHLTGTSGVTVGGNACTSVSVVSDSEVTCTLPAGTAGSADVVLTTPGGSATDSGAYTYVAAPTITSVSPTAGPLDGGLLTINGTNLAGATAITVGGSTCSPVTMPSATQIICTLPAHAAGTVDVSVTTPGGSVTDSGAYTYQALPTITSVAPSAGPLIGGSTLTITGTDLTNASAVTVGGNACTPYTVVSATEITCLLPAGTAGSADVAVTTPGGSATDPAAYDYLPIPTITSVSPAAGPLSGGGTLTIIGTGFTGANALTVGGNGCTPYTVVSDTEVTCVLPAGTAGSADVSVGTPGGSATDPGAYQYLAAPTVTSISPSAGPAKGGNAVTITGDGFTPDSAVTIGGSACTSVTVVSTTELTCVVPAGVVGTVDVSVTTPGGTATLAGAYQYQAPSGYWLVGADGGVFSFGTQFYGSTGNLTLNAPVFAMTSTSDGKGYWFVARDGGVFSYGDAQFHGSLPQMGEHVDDITGMTVDPATGGYWLVGANGGVYAFDAPFAGSLPGRGIQAADIVGIASTPTGLGYYLVGSNGAVYPFGDARAQGEASTMPFINAPIVGISVDSATGGYWEVGADGGVYSYGAPFHGSMAGTALNRPIVGMSATPDGSGYYLVGGDGGVFAFNAPFLGSLAGKPLRAPIVGTTTAGAV